LWLPVGIDESITSSFEVVVGVSNTKACFIVESTVPGLDPSKDALSWGVYLYLQWRFLLMTDPVATLLSVSTGAPFGKDVLAVLQSQTCPVAAYVIAQLAVEVRILTNFPCACLFL
jgi:hypothetical protein